MTFGDEPYDEEIESERRGWKKVRSIIIGSDKKLLDFLRESVEYYQHPLLPKTVGKDQELLGLKLKRETRAKKL